MVGFFQRELPPRGVIIVSAPLISVLLQLSFAHIALSRYAQANSRTMNACIKYRGKGKETHKKTNQVARLFSRIDSSDRGVNHPFAVTS